MGDGGVGVHARCAPACLWRICCAGMLCLSILIGVKLSDFFFFSFFSIFQSDDTALAAA